MLDYNEIKPKKFIIFEDEPYEVLESHVFRKQQRKPVNATKMRNLMSGRVVEHSFHVSDKATEAELEKRSIKFIYQNRGEFWFTEASDAAKRFTLDPALLGDKARFLKPTMLIDLITFEEKNVGIQMPIKVELTVTEAAPGVRGDTAKGGMKLVTVETGAAINVPLFVQEGDRVVINTESGEYIERAGN